MIQKRRFAVGIPANAETRDMIIAAAELQNFIQELIQEKAESCTVQWIDIAHKGPTDLFIRGFSIIAERGSMTEDEREQMLNLSAGFGVKCAS